MDIYSVTIYGRRFIFSTIDIFSVWSLFYRKLPNTVFKGIRERGATNNKVFNYVYIIAQKVLDYKFIFWHLTIMAGSNALSSYVFITPSSVLCLKHTLYLSPFNAVAV